MARSIGDWYADHESSSLGDDVDDDVVERQAPWDLRTSGYATTRSDRRDAGFAGRTRSRAAGTWTSAPRRRTRPQTNSDPSPTVDALPGVPAAVREKITAAVQAHPDAGAKQIAAMLRAAGTYATRAHVKAVKKAQSATKSTAPYGRSRIASSGQANVPALIRRAARANPGVGHKRIAAILRSDGVAVTRAQVAATLRPARISTSRTPRSATRSKPAMVIRVSAGAQTSRTIHETPLCPSCGVRLSVIGTCRCS